MNSIKHPQKNYMLQAISHVKSHIKANEGGPFGACIVQGDKVIALAHNTVLKTCNPTAHAEMNAIQLATEKLQNIDLSDCVIYSTTEPCPMCFSAIHWARLKHIIYGTDISDVQKLGFNELSISNDTLKTLSKSNILISSDFERNACAELLQYWSSQSNNQTY